jgi:hypothetical protein
VSKYYFKEVGALLGEMSQALRGYLAVQARPAVALRCEGRTRHS